MVGKAHFLVLAFLVGALVLAAAEPGNVAPGEIAPGEVNPKREGDPPDPAPAPAEGDATPEAPPEAEPAQKGFALEDHVARLNHEQYKERTTAQQALLEWGQQDLDRGIESLYGVYRKAEDPEIRLRSRQVLRRLVIDRQPFDGEGYLGIQMETAQGRNAKGELQPAVMVTIVREGTAAEIAKLQANDLILGVDEVVFDDLVPIRLFADYIKSKKPGDVITLQVARDGEFLELTAALRRRSPLLDRLTQWGTQLDLPPQEELDEADFQDWLKSREARNRQNP